MFANDFALYGTFPQDWYENADNLTSYKTLDEIVVNTYPFLNYLIGKKIGRK